MSDIVLLNDRVDYYSYYLQSIVDLSAPLPMLTNHQHIMQQKLERQQLEYSNNVGRSDVPEWLQSLAHSLHVGAREANMNEMNNLYKHIKMRVGAEIDTKKNDWIVGVGQSAGLALLRAVADGRPFLAVADEKALIPALLSIETTSLYVVTDKLSDTTISCLMDHFSPIGELNNLPSVGFLHARTFELMTWLDAKQRWYNRKSANADLDSQKHLIIDSFSTKMPRKKDPDLVLTTYENVHKGLINTVGRLGLLSVTSHGMCDLIHLNRDYICGKSAYVHIDSWTNHRLPSCMGKEGQCFYKPTGEALEAHEIMADHIFINSCGSLRLQESIFDPLFNISYTVLEGHARSFVGSIRWKDGHGLESLFYYRLLKAGYSLGQVVTLLNHALLANQFEMKPNAYVLLGDPEDRFVSKEISISGEIVEGKRTILLENGLKILTITDRKLLEAFERAQLFVQVKNSDIRVTMVPNTDRNQLHIFFFSYTEEAMYIEVEVKNLQPIHEDLLEKYQLLDRSLNPSLGINRIYPNQVKQGRKKNLEQRFLSLSRQLKSCFTGPERIGKLLSSYEKFLNEVDRIDAEIAYSLYDSIRKTSFRFSEHYQDSFLLVPDFSDEICYICQQKLTARRLRHVLNPKIERVEFICSSCGSIEDKPDTSLNLKINFEEEMPRGQSHAITFKVENHGAHDTEGYMLAAIRKSSEYGLASEDPVRKVKIPAGGSEEISFDLPIRSDIPIHQYHLQAAYISKAQVYLSGRMLWITGEVLGGI